LSIRLENPLRRGFVPRIFLPILAVAIGSARPAAAQTEPPRFMTVVDASHGGDDAGGKTGSQAEKAYTLALAAKLRSLLGARGIQVTMTRESDAALDANHRAEIANRANAQACLSLHATTSGSGVHLFVSSVAAGRPQQFLPWKTAQGAWVAHSMELAGVLDSALTNAGMTVTLGRTALPGIDSMTCPAVAVEIAPEKAGNGASLDDVAYQSRVLKALAAALLQWRSQTGAHQP
jgi:N-acetylmuramoyl-L-alanine amidase